MMLLAISSQVVFAQLPKDSQDLISKLTNWELDRQAELQKEIEAKRSEVIEVLKKHLRTTTKAGNLEGALAIRKEIERLTDSNATTTAPTNIIDSTTTKSVVATKWQYRSIGIGSLVTATFQENGKLLISTADGRITKTKGWRSNEDGTATVTMDGVTEIQTWTFSEDFDSAKIENSTKPGEHLEATRQK